MLARHVKLSRTSTQADVRTDFKNSAVNHYHTGVSLMFSPGGEGWGNWFQRQTMF